MNIKQLAFGLLIIGLISSKSTPKEKDTELTTTNPYINIAGAMKNVIWKGELSGTIKLDTISNKQGLYGLGPLSYLTGELLINNGQSYVSKVTSD